MKINTIVLKLNFPGTDMDHNKDQLQCLRKYNVLFKTAYDVVI